MPRLDRRYARDVQRFYETPQPFAGLLLLGLVILFLVASLFPGE